VTADDLSVTLELGGTMNLVFNPYFSTPVCKRGRQSFSFDGWELGDPAFNASVKSGLPGRANPSPCNTAIRWYSGRPLYNPPVVKARCWQWLGVPSTATGLLLRFRYVTLGTGQIEVAIVNSDNQVEAAVQVGGHVKTWQQSPWLGITVEKPGAHMVQLSCWHSGRGGGKLTDIEVEVV